MCWWLFTTSWILFANSSSVSKSPGWKHVSSLSHDWSITPRKLEKRFCPSVCSPLMNLGNTPTLTHCILWWLANSARVCRVVNLSPEVVGETVNAAASLSFHGWRYQKSCVDSMKTLKAADTVPNKVGLPKMIKSDVPMTWKSGVATSWRLTDMPFALNDSDRNLAARSVCLSDASWTMETCGRCISVNL
mgnify:CR=1 FL=1